MEIEVGEYVRTGSGEIFKVIDIEKGSIKIKSDYREWIGMCCIVKHSENIIDLIEEGDYVNGELVTFVQSDNEVIATREHCRIENEDIKSIVTKEAYKNIEYRLE